MQELQQLAASTTHWLQARHFLRGLLSTCSLLPTSPTGALHSEVRSQVCARAAVVTLRGLVGFYLTVLALALGPLVSNLLTITLVSLGRAQGISHHLMAGNYIRKRARVRDPTQF